MYKLKVRKNAELRHSDSPYSCKTSWYSAKEYLPSFIIYAQCFIRLKV